MEVPHPSSGVLDLEYDLLEKLLSILQLNDAWKLVANATGVFSEIDIRRMAVDSSSSYELLNELHNKMCSVSTLCHILEKCQLFEALAILKEPEPITITVHPGSEAGCMYVPMGRELRLHCQAIGLPPPQYSWYHENQELSDQRSSTLSIMNFSPKNEGEYYCCVSQHIRESNEVFSSSVNVMILPECPSIVQQPNSMFGILEGECITLTCRAHGYPLPTYEWFKENTLIDGESSEELFIENAGVCKSGNYKCYVKNIGGDVWSVPAKIEVIRQTSRPIVTAKIALLIANDTYPKLTSLINPSNDVVLLADQLSQLGFKVIALQNLTLIEMKNAVRMFCKLLPENAYGLFYFAGHGFQMQDKFMLPVNAPGSESFLRSDSLCEKEVIRDVLNTKPQLCVILLDMCLRIPDISENPAIHDEVPELFTFVPKRNLIQGYATSSNLAAFEKKTEINGIYVKHLSTLIMEHLPINTILERVGKAVALENPDVSDQQIPSRIENVTTDFYFNDEVIEHHEVDGQFRNLNYLPDDTTIWFKNLKFVAHAKFYPYRHCFNNALEIWITNVEKWKVECQVGYQGLELKLERKKDEKNHLVVTIHNLQKVRIPLMLTLSLFDDKPEKLVDNGTLDLEMPLIATAHLWFPQQSEHQE